MLDHTHGCLLLARSEPLRLRQRQAVRLEMNKPSAIEEPRLLPEVLGPLTSRLDRTLEALVSRFDLGVEETSNACTVVRSRIEGRRR